jgi:hypothetical protein
VNPKIVVGMHVKLSKVIDLTKLKRSKIAGDFWLDELLAEDWRKLNSAGQESQSQAFGRAAHDLGAEAVIAPSARLPGEKNLIFFPESILGYQSVQIIGKAEMEKWLKKR